MGIVHDPYFPDFDVLACRKKTGITGSVGPKKEPIEFPASLIPRPLGFRVIVKPKPAADCIGMIALASRTKNADLASRTIGQLVAIGPLAWKAKLDGLDLSEDTTAQRLKVGDWVIFRQHSGQKIKLAAQAEAFDGDEKTEQFLLLMTDTDILAALTEEQVEELYDWVT